MCKTLHVITWAGPEDCWGLSWIVDHTAIRSHTMVFKCRDVLLCFLPNTSILTNNRAWGCSSTRSVCVWSFTLWASWHSLCQHDSAVQHVQILSLAQPCRCSSTKLWSFLRYESEDIRWWRHKILLKLALASKLNSLRSGGVSVRGNQMTKHGAEIVGMKYLVMHLATSPAKLLCWALKFALQSERLSLSPN